MGRLILLLILVFLSLSCQERKLNGEKLKLTPINGKPTLGNEVKFYTLFFLKKTNEFPYNGYFFELLYTENSDGSNSNKSTDVKIPFTFNLYRTASDSETTKINLTVEIEKSKINLEALIKSEKHTSLKLASNKLGISGGAVCIDTDCKQIVSCIYSSELPKHIEKYMTCVNFQSFQCSEDANEPCALTHLGYVEWSNPKLKDVLEKNEKFSILENKELRDQIQWSVIL